MKNIDFADFKFKVIDITVNGVAELVVNRKGLNFSQKLVEEMGNPGFIRTMLDIEKKVFAIQACKSSDLNAVKFSKPKNEQKGGVTVTSAAIMRILRTTMEDKWNENHRYKISAKVFSEAKAAIFYLDTFKESELYKVNRKR